jgi:aminoglycoside 6-adenylyltransferase
MTTDSAAMLLERIVAWSRANPNVLALIMTGSRARVGGRPDEFSDYDLEIIAEDTATLRDDDAWLRAFAPVMVYLPLDEGQRYPTRLVFYEGGMKVDFTLATRDRVTDMARAGLDDLYRRGYKVLLDKQRLTDALPPPTGAFPKRPRPSPEAFYAVVTEFWFEAAHIPRYLLRDELWVAKFRDWTMKELLLRMLEWHALSRAAEPIDVWHIGLHMKQWLDEQTARELRDIFGEYNAMSSWRALLATAKLFRRLTIETAASLGIAAADDTATRVIAHIATFEHRIQ